MSTITRLVTRLAATSAVAVLAVGLAACASDAEGAREPAAADQDAETITVTDELGREVVIDGPVERAIILNSYAVEYVNALGKAGTIVGTDKSVDARWPHLGLTGDKVIAQTFTEIDYEAVVAADPDVFILPRNSDYEETAAKLAEFGIPVAVVTTWDSTLFEDNVTLLGQIFGEDERAQEIIELREGIFDFLAERLDGVEPKTVYFSDADPSVTYLPGSGYFESLEAAGGESIFADAQNTSGAFPTATVDAAEILDRDPDAIILQYIDSQIVPAASTAEIGDFFTSVKERPEFADSRAAEDGNVILANGTAYNFLSKAIWAVYVAHWLHPDRVTEADAQEYLRIWTEEFSGTTIAPGSDFAIATNLR